MMLIIAYSYLALCMSLRKYITALYNHTVAYLQQGLLTIKFNTQTKRGCP